MYLFVTVNSYFVLLSLFFVIYAVKTLTCFLVIILL